MTDTSADTVKGDAVHAASPRASSTLADWRDYVSLMKPRVMTLVVFTGLAGLVAAPGSMNPIAAAIAILCIAVGAGAAGAFNMAYDADIDAVMKRTRRRPVPTGRVPREEAYVFAGVMSLGSVLLMALATNYVAAGLLAFSIFFYCVIYTMWLKRSTPQNIVIGGAAGAFPPMIGWAAVTGTITLDSLLLFAIIFLWTPPHSWALALYKSGDYSAAGVPMMPVAKGAKSTRQQILFYTGLYLAATAGPVLTGLGGLVYTGAVVLGGALFALLALRVFNSRAGDGNNAEDELYAVRAGDKAARDLFAYSIAHLTLLFAALLVEHGAGAFWALPSFGG
ncbi:heme o synthase [Maricaulaceae bacterium EIL42A08]|nr:heme o synthase [Maricaulaceae bacterium EIL42A08]